MNFFSTVSQKDLQTIWEPLLRYINRNGRAIKCEGTDAEPRIINCRPKQLIFKHLFHSLVILVVISKNSKYGYKWHVTGIKAL
jgi:hypothetical protein